MPSKNPKDKRPRDKTALGITARKEYITSDGQKFEHYSKAMAHTIKLDKERKCDALIIAFTANTANPDSDYVCIVEFLKKHGKELKELL